MKTSPVSPVKVDKPLSEKSHTVLKKYLADCMAIGIKGMVDEFEALNKECAALEKPACVKFKENEKLNRSPEVLCPDKSR